MNPYDVKITPVAPTVVEGQSVTITCSAKGKPAPTLSWSRGETPLTNNWVDYTITQSSAPITGNETLVSSDLHILAIDTDDLGNYTCEVANKLVKMRTHKSLTIHCK